MLNLYSPGCYNRINIKQLVFYLYFFRIQSWMQWGGGGFAPDSVLQKLASDLRIYSTAASGLLFSDYIKVSEILPLLMIDIFLPFSKRAWRILSGERWSLLSK